MIRDKIHCTTLSNQKKNPYKTDDLDCSLRNNKANRQFKKQLFSYVKEITQTDS